MPENKNKKRLRQVADSVRRHRSTRDRLEVYIPGGWRERLRLANASEGLTTSAWVRQIVADRIGEELENEEN